MVSKTLFIIPTDAQYYKIIGMLKKIKIPTVAPSCFGAIVGILIVFNNPMIL